MKPTKGLETIDDLAINRRLREDSGSVDYSSSDWLTSFLYELMRDSAPPGAIERLVRNIELESKDGDNLYSNGWLARYAKNLADRLRSVERGEGDVRKEGGGDVLHRDDEGEGR